MGTIEGNSHLKHQPLRGPDERSAAADGAVSEEIPERFAKQAERYETLRVSYRHRGLYTLPWPTLYRILQTKEYKLTGEGEGQGRKYEIGGVVVTHKVLFPIQQQFFTEEPVAEAFSEKTEAKVLKLEGVPPEFLPYAKRYELMRAKRGGEGVYVLNWLQMRDVLARGEYTRSGPSKNGVIHIGGSEIPEWQFRNIRLFFPELIGKKLNRKPIDPKKI